MTRARSFAAAARAVAVAAALAATLAATRTAHANALDTFGFSARSAGVAGAMVAGAQGYEGAHHNPALVAGARDIEAAIGYSYTSTQLHIGGADAQVTTPRGTSLGLAIPFHMGPFTAAFGLALYIPDQFVVRIQLVPAAEPHFVLLDDNLHHVVVTPVAALRWRWLAIGAGATILADAAGNGITFDVGVVGGDKVGKAQLDVALPTRAAPVLGIAAEPVRGLKLGAAWRGEIDLGLKLDILANVDIAGAITGDTLISLRAVNFFTPHKLSFGASAAVGRGLTLHGEVDWLMWSRFTGALPDLRTLLELGLAPSLVESLLPRSRFNDAVAVRLGAELRIPATELVTFVGRFGYAFEPTPVPEQRGLTNFADNDRHVIGFGAGVAVDHVGRILRRPLTFDVALQLHELAPRFTDKDPRWFPGGQLSSSGRMVHFQATLELRL
jgi:hypothetical protein